MDFNEIDAPAQAPALRANQHGRRRRRFLAAAAVAAVVAATLVLIRPAHRPERTAPPQGGSESRIEVHAFASVVHNGRTYSLTFGGEQAIATSPDGRTTTATFNSRGDAVLSLAPGQYQVTTSEADACASTKLTIPTSARVLDLRCALP